MNKCEWTNCTGILVDGVCPKCTTDNTIAELRKTRDTIQFMLGTQGIKLTTVDGIVFLESQGYKMPVWTDDKGEMLT